MINLALALTIITALPPNYTVCAPENSICKVSGSPVNAIFGVGNAFSTPVVMTSDFPCTTATFGGDPNLYAVKQCYTSNTDSSVPDPGNGGVILAPIPLPAIDTHGFYAYNLVPALAGSDTVWTTFLPTPPGCIDTAGIRYFTDKVTGRYFLAGWCQKKGYIFTWSRERIPPFADSEPFPATWPTE